MKQRTPWVFMLPHGLRDQPASAFIGLLCALSGVGYLTGYAESNSITRILDPTWMRIWGGFIFMAGILLMVSLFTSNRALEMLGSRFISLCGFVYVGWLLAAVPLKNAAFAIAMCLITILVLEVRVAVIKVLLKPLPKPREEI